MCANWVYVLTELWLVLYTFGIFLTIYNSPDNGKATRIQSFNRKTQTYNAYLNLQR